MMERQVMVPMAALQMLMLVLANSTGTMGKVSCHHDPHRSRRRMSLSAREGMMQISSPS